MSTAYAIPGTAALVEWVLAVVLFAVGWHSARRELNPWGEGLTVAGVVTTSAGVVWLALGKSINLALSRSSLATGFAVCLLVGYALFAHGREERLSALATLGLAVPVQAYAVGRLWWGLASEPQELFLPAWQVLRVLAGLLGYASLAVAAIMIVLSFVLARAADRLSEGQLSAAKDLVSVEWLSLQVALVALTLSLSAGLIHAWWGLGHVLDGSFPWAPVTWLLMVSGLYALLQGALPRRSARGLLVLAALTGIMAVLAMGG
jgi:hypothetical protein